MPKLNKFKKNKTTVQNKNKTLTIVICDPMLKIPSFLRLEFLKKLVLHYFQNFSPRGSFRFCH